MICKLMAPPGEKRPRGGWKMQANAARSRSPPRQAHYSHTVLGHLRSWGEGKLTAVDLWKCMRNMQQDKFEHPAIERLSKIAAGGENHCLANLIGLLDSHTEISTFLTELPTGDTVQWCIKPTTVFCKLLTANREKFMKTMVGGSEQRIENFWTGLFASEHGKELKELHPWLRDKSPSDLKRAVPLRLHEDAGPFSLGGSVNVLSWSPLLGKGLELESKFVYCNYIKQAGEIPDSNAWKLFVDDLEMLAAGMLPDGTSIAGSDNLEWSGIMIFGGADLEVECLCWGLASYNEATSDCCGWCLGDKLHRPLTDLRRQAAWRSTEIMSNDLFMERVRSSRNHPISHAAFANKHFFRLDVMHVYDHHGIACIVVASTLRHSIVNDMSLGPNQQHRLDAVNVLVDTFNRESKATINIPRFKLHNLTLDDWSELHGPLYKSAICRHCAQFSLYFAERYYTTTSDFDVAVLAANRALCKVYDILYTAGTFMTAGELEELKTITMELGLSFHLLRDICKQRGELFWHVKPKVHIGQHLAHQCILINARMIQNYAEESLIGKMALIWEASCSGPYHRTIQRHTLLKYLVFWAILAELA